jgi:hypothetical protein
MILSRKAFFKKGDPVYSVFFWKMRIENMNEIRKSEKTALEAFQNYD